MTMLQRLILALILGAIVSAFPLSVMAGDGDDQGQNDDDQGGIVIRCPPTGCIQ